MLFSKSSFLLLFVGLFGAACVIFIPYLDYFLNPTSTSPGLITIIGTGLTLSLITLVALYIGRIDQWSNKVMFFFYFLIYNFLLILIKFSFSPASLYRENKMRPFVLGPLLPSNPNTVEYLMLVGALVLILYLGGLFVLYKIFQSTLKEKTTFPQLEKKSWDKLLIIIGIAVIVAFAFITGAMGILLVPVWIILVAWAPVLSYFSFLLPPAFAAVIAGGLILLLAFASLSFRSAALYAKTMKNASILTAVVWIAGGLLIVFHGLWIIYFLILVRIWPLRVVSPSGK